MIVMALVTAIFWDALALDERDLAVMGPLPVRPAAVLVAKAAAVTGAAALVAARAQRPPGSPLPRRRPAQGAGRPARRAARRSRRTPSRGSPRARSSSSRCRRFAGPPGSSDRAASPAASCRSSSSRWSWACCSLLLALPILAGRTREAIASGSSSVLLLSAAVVPRSRRGADRPHRDDFRHAGARRARRAGAVGGRGRRSSTSCALFLRSHRLGAGAGSPTSVTGRMHRRVDRAPRAGAVERRPRSRELSLHRAHAHPQSAPSAVSRLLARRRPRGRGRDDCGGLCRAGIRTPGACPKSMALAAQLNLRAVGDVEPQRADGAAVVQADAVAEHRAHLVPAVGGVAGVDEHGAEQRRQAGRAARARTRCCR